MRGAECIHRPILVSGSPGANRRGTGNQAWARASYVIALHKRKERRMRTLFFLAIVLTALALVPGGAHLFAMPNKIDLAQDAYFTAQAIYAGWSLFGIVLFACLAANLAAAVAVRRQPVPFTLSLAAFLLVAATLVIFFVWTYPANQATSNWTMAPDNWQALRSDWEYAHAVNALLTFVALCCITRAALTAGRRHHRSGTREALAP
jgi:hypothetical protein